MGLKLVVGMLANVADGEEQQEIFRQLEAVNSALERQGLMHHMEPADLGGQPAWSCDLIANSALHYLRRIAAHLALGNPLPAPGDANADQDPAIQEYFDRPRGFVHLMVHNDSEGFYVPLDFMPVVIADESLEVPGGMIGSSYRLRDECEELARVLELPLDLALDSPELVDAIQHQGEGDTQWKRYAVESHTCLALYHAANKSIDTGAALVFC